MNTIIDYLLFLFAGIGIAGGIGFIILSLRDYYYERKWAKQWAKENKDWALEDLLAELRRDER